MKPESDLASLRFELEHKAAEESAPLQPADKDRENYIRELQNPPSQAPEIKPNVEALAFEKRRREEEKNLEDYGDIRRAA